MIKYVVLMIGLLLLSSCKESESESDITKEMRDYISNNVDGSYGFFERNIVRNILMVLAGNLTYIEFNTNSICMQAKEELY